MTVEHYDYARSFQPKRDYFGEIIEGERGRPMQICIWYPAVETQNAVQVVYSDYAFSPPDDMRQYAFLAGIQNREITLLHGFLNNNQVAVLEVLAADMGAAKGAEHAGGTFPLLVYHSNLDRGIGENAVMFEYLASHGFVVATTHSFGPSAITAEPTPAVLETFVGDMEFVIAALRDMEFTDPDRLGVFGYRAGGLAALLLGMRNHNVDAVLGLQTVSADQDLIDIASSNPFYDTARMTAPLFQAYTGTEDGRGRDLMESFEYATRYSLEFHEGVNVNFSAYGVIAGLFGGAEPEEAEAGPEFYPDLCEYALHFFKAHLGHDETGLASLDDSPAVRGMEEDIVTLTAMASRQRPPTQDEFMGILQDGRVDTAVAIYEGLRQEDPDIVLFPEAQMNIMGYRFLQRGMVREAITILNMNAEAYPRSANCWDSLAEAYIAGGDNDHALECVDMVIQVLPEDTNISEDLRRTLQANAERYKAMLEETPEDESE
jgi:tetratricopeptide (TPR) repeat protein